MAKFKNDSLDLETGEKIDFNDSDTISMGYDGAELYVSSTISGVAAVQPYHVVILSQLEDAIDGITISGGGGTFGSYYAYAKSDGESSSNSTTWIDKVTLDTGTIVSGTYKIAWYSELGRNSQSTDFKYRILLDGTTDLCNINFEFSDQSGWMNTTGFDVITLSSGTHSVAIQFSGETTTNTSYIRRARVDIARII